MQAAELTYHNSASLPAQIAVLGRIAASFSYKNIPLHRFPINSNEATMVTKHAFRDEYDLTRILRFLFLFLQSANDCTKLQMTASTLQVIFNG